MNGIGAKPGACRTAYDFNAVGGFGDGIKQAVYVRKACGAKGHAVFQIEKGTSPGTARQNRRANGRQMFLTRSVLNKNTRCPVHQLTRMVGSDELDVGFVDAGDVSRMSGSWGALSGRRDQQFVQLDGALSLDGIGHG